MANRRVSDSTPPVRGTPPPAAEKKPRQRAAKPHVATPAVDAAVEAALESALSAAAANAAPKSRKRRSGTEKSQGIIAATKAGVSEDVRRGMIAKSAYLRAERRGFAPGGEAEDWIAAEKEVDALLNNAPGSAQ